MGRRGQAKTAEMPAVSHRSPELDRQVRLTRQVQLDLALVRAFEVRGGHGPGIDDIGVKPGVGGEVEFRERRLMVVEKVQVVLARHGGTWIVGIDQRCQPAGRVSLDQLSQERDSRRALAMQYASFRPPEDL